VDTQSRDRAARAAARERDVNRDHRIVARDAGLDLISRANRWMVAGAVGMTGAVSLYASHAFHAAQHHTSAASSRRAASASPTSTGQTSTSQTATSTNLSLTSPQSAPAPAAPAPSAVVSGGS
jgi:hypothetical protein